MPLHISRLIKPLLQRVGSLLILNSSQSTSPSIPPNLQWHTLNRSHLGLQTHAGIGIGMHVRTLIVFGHMSAQHVTKRATKMLLVPINQHRPDLLTSSTFACPWHPPRRTTMSLTFTCPWHPPRRTTTFLMLTCPWHPLRHTTTFLMFTCPWHPPRHTPLSLTFTCLWHPPTVRPPLLQ